MPPFRHGMGLTPEYCAWSAARGRCTNPRNRAYHRYGGRGITISEHWRDFRQFLTDMGPKPSPQHQLERRDNDQGYAQDNCYWATKLEQARNKGGRRPTCRLTCRGETLTIVQWSERTGFSTNQIRNRLRKGWSHQRALTEPLHIEHRNHHPKPSNWGRISK